MPVNLKIVGLIGDARVGKDTFASEFVTKHNFIPLAFADPIKAVARLLFDFTDEQCQTDKKDQIDVQWGIKPRDFFKTFGTELMQRDIYNYLPDLNIPKKHIWSQILINKLKNLIKNGHLNFIITDIRFPHEMEDIKEFVATHMPVNFVTVKITRGQTHSLVHSITSHESQTALNLMCPTDIHYTISNDGTLDDFLGKSHDFIQSLILKQI